MYGAAFDRLLGFEGGYADNPVDRGGATVMGISSKYFPDQFTAVKTLLDEGKQAEAQALARDFYQKEFWEKSGADKIQDPTMAYAVFDTAVNSGIPKAQELYKMAGDDVNKFADARLQYVNDIMTNDPTQETFREGWTRRINEIRNPLISQAQAAEGGEGDDVLTGGAGEDSLIDVELPDGTVIEGVPADISKTDLIARLKRNGLDTSTLEGVAPTQETADNVDQPPVAEEAENKTGLMSLPKDNLGRRIGAGARTAGQGLSFGTLDEIQGYGAAPVVWALKNLFTDDKVSFDETLDHTLGKARGELDEMRDDYPIQSFLTEVAGSLPTGGAVAKGLKAASPSTMSALSRYAAANPVKAGAGIAAGAGGVYGFNEGEDGLDNRLENAGESALLSIPFGAGGGYIANKFGGRSATIADDITGAMDDGADDVMRAAGAAPGAPQTSALARLSGDEAARSKILTDVGIPADKQTAGMLSRDPKVWQFEQNTKGIQGVGDEIRNRYVQANEIIKGALDNLGVKTGGKATTPYEAGESVTTAVLSKNKEMQAEVGKLYGKIRDEAGTNPGLKPQKLFEAISDASDNAYADNVVNSMIRRLEKFGVVEKGTGQINEAAQLTVSQAEELRKFANTLRGDRQTEGIVSNIINALDDDVIDTAGTDAFKAARDAARGRFTEFETRILNNITQGNLVSDDVLNRTVYGGKVKDLQALKESLTSGTDDQIARGAEAWSDLKLQTLQRMIDESTTGGGKVQGGAFNKQMKKIGKERLETVFDPEELLQLKTIQKALEYTTIEVPESVVNYSGTGAANANNALSGILQRSRVGEFLEKTGDTVANAPGGSLLSFGTFGTPQALGFMGRAMQDSAKRGNVQRVLNPESALRRFANPSVVRRAGQAGGVAGANQADNE